MSDYVQIRNHQSSAVGNYTAQRYTNGTGSGFGEVLKVQEDKGAQKQSANTRSENAEDTDYTKQLHEHMEEMLEKIRHSTIQPKIQIGAQEYTQEEWKKLLEKFDEAEEELIEQVQAEIEIRMENAEEEKAKMEEMAKEEMKSAYVNPE